MQFKRPVTTAFYVMVAGALGVSAASIAMAQAPALSHSPASATQASKPGGSVDAPPPSKQADSPVTVVVIPSQQTQNPDNALQGLEPPDTLDTQGAPNLPHTGLELSRILPVGGFSTGIEYVWGERRDLDGQRAIANRIDGLIQFNF
jgi:hypothetical protein